MGGRLPPESVVAFALESLAAFARKTQSLVSIAPIKTGCGAFHVDLARPGQVGRVEPRRSGLRRPSHRRAAGWAVPSGHLVFAHASPYDNF